MNKYFKNLSKIEFVITNACTGRCKHCSEGEHISCGERIDPQIAANAVRRIVDEYDIKTVMTFGGEPLLYADSVYAIMNVAKELNVAHRQVITNGYFSKDVKRIQSVARALADCGVNDLRLSVDAFHQEVIPLDIVKIFASEAKNCGIPVTLQPAYLVSKTDNNPYNITTREILDSFVDMYLPIGEGNVIFPEGNAIKYLLKYFEGDVPKNPYVEDVFDMRCVSFSPNGDVLGGNVYSQDIIEIINN